MKVFFLQFKKEGVGERKTLRIILERQEGNTKILSNHFKASIKQKTCNTVLKL